MKSTKTRKEQALISAILSYSNALLIDLNILYYQIIFFFKYQHRHHFCMRQRQDFIFIMDISLNQIYCSLKQKIQILNGINQFLLSIMEGQDPNEFTPHRNAKDDVEEETGHKLNMKDDLVQSKFENQDKSDQGQEIPNRKEQEKKSESEEIQEEIKAIEKRLQQIRLEELKQTDKYSEDYLSLEHERTELKKRVIELEYLSRVNYANFVRQSRRKDAEREEQLKQERQRKKRQLDQKYQALKQERLQTIKQTQAKKQQSKAQNEKSNQKPQNEQQEQQAKKKREQRINQIELQLAQSRLRRSRMASLRSELDYLRATYDYPYWRWRDYFLSYPYRPLYSSPYLYPHTYSYLSPYSPSYLYPYSSYLYPYSSPYLYSPYRYPWY